MARVQSPESFKDTPSDMAFPPGFRENEGFYYYCYFAGILLFSNSFLSVYDASDVAFSIVPTSESTISLPHALFILVFLLFPLVKRQEGDFDEVDMMAPPTAEEMRGLEGIEDDFMEGTDTDELDEEDVDADVIDVLRDLRKLKKPKE
jgi:hypothetical protein